MKWEDLAPEGWLCPHLPRGIPYPSGTIHRDAAGRPEMLSFTSIARWEDEWCPRCGWLRRTKKGGLATAPSAR